ncbi:uncharacterized protein [Macaca fascicularis]|uniref:uncharacterized protein n=1 Tax=Macaca fascicularis TaxID=9541 RepID=UPI0032B0323F
MAGAVPLMSPVCSHELCVLTGPPSHSEKGKVGTGPRTTAPPTRFPRTAGVFPVSSSPHSPGKVRGCGRRAERGGLQAGQSRPAGTDRSPGPSPEGTEDRALSGGSGDSVHRLCPAAAISRRCR